MSAIAAFGATYGSSIRYERVGSQPFQTCGWSEPVWRTNVHGSIGAPVGFRRPSPEAPTLKSNSVVSLGSPALTATRRSAPSVTPLTGGPAVSVSVSMS